MHGIHLRIGSPTDPSDRTLAYRIDIACAHARSTVIWGRVCPQGCEDTPTGGQRHCPTTHGGRCALVFPSDELLTEMGLRAHQERTHCPCIGRFWMVYGPEHHQVNRPQITGPSGGHTLPAREWQALRAHLGHGGHR